MKKLFGNTVRKLSSSSSTSTNFNLRRLSLHSNSSTLNQLQIKVLRGGYNIDLDKVDSSFTKLHKAVYMNNVEKVKKYLSGAKYSVNALDSSNRSVLHLAAINGNLTIIKLLINAGANVNLQDSDGRTPMIKAVECGHADVLQILMEFGADIDLADREKGNTALHHALIDANLECALYIIRNALIIDYNRRNHKKETFLHLASKIVDLFPVIEELIANGIEIEATDELGRTAAQIAQLHNNNEAFRVITKYATAKAQPVVASPGADDQLSASLSHSSYENTNATQQQQQHPQISRATSRSSKLSSDSFGSNASSATGGHNFYRFSGLFEETIVEENKNSSSSTSTSSPKNSAVKPPVERTESIYENYHPQKSEALKSPTASEGLSDEMSELDQMLASNLNTDLIDLPRQQSTPTLPGKSTPVQSNRNRKADWLELLEERESPIRTAAQKNVFTFNSPLSPTSLASPHRELSPIHQVNQQHKSSSPSIASSGLTSPPMSPKGALSSPLASPMMSPGSSSSSPSARSASSQHRRDSSQNGAPLSYAQVASATPRKVSPGDSQSKNSSAVASPAASNSPVSPASPRSGSSASVRRNASIRMNNNFNPMTFQHLQQPPRHLNQQQFSPHRNSLKQHSSNDFDRSRVARHSTGARGLPNGHGNRETTTLNGQFSETANTKGLSYARVAQQPPTSPKRSSNPFSFLNGTSISSSPNRCIDKSVQANFESQTSKYEALLESVDRLLNSNQLTGSSENAEWNNEMQLLKRLSSLVYDSNHNAIELEYKRKEVALLKQTVESLQAQVEHEQTLKKQFELKLRKLGMTGRNRPMSNGHLESNQEADYKLKQYEAMLRQQMNENANLKEEIDSLREQLRGQNSLFQATSDASLTSATTAELGTLLTQLDNKLASLNELHAERARAHAEENQLRDVFIEQFRGEISELKQIMFQLMTSNANGDPPPESPISNGHMRRHSDFAKLERSKVGSQKLDIDHDRLSPRKSFSLHDLVSLDDLILDDLNGLDNVARKSYDDHLQQAPNGGATGKSRKAARSNFQADYSNSFSYKSKYFQSKINELRKQLGIVSTQ